MYKKFNKLYVGYQDREGEGYLGFMTPYCDISNKTEHTKFLRRKQSVDSWSESWRSKSNISSKIFDNLPSSNFAIERTVSRYSTSNKMWRVYDPRGFYLEIDSYNLDYLIQNFNIINGIFDGNLIWTRHGSNNYLLGYDSQEYKDAVDYIENKDSYIKESTINYNDVVKLSNGETIRYIGRFHCVTIEGYSSRELKISKTLKSYYTSVRDGNVATLIDKYLKDMTKLKVVNIVERGSGSITIEMLNDKYKTNKFRFRDSKNKSFKLEMYSDKGEFIKLNGNYIILSSNWNKNKYEIYTLTDTKLIYHGHNEQFNVGNDTHSLRITNA